MVWLAAEWILKLFFFSACSADVSDGEPQQPPHRRVQGRMGRRGSAKYQTTYKAVNLIGIVRALDFTTPRLNLLRRYLQGTSVCIVTSYCEGGDM